MIGITSTAKGKGLNKSPKTALSPTFQPPHLPSPCRANTKPPSPIGTSRSSHLSPETNTKTQNQLIYSNLKECRCKPQNSPVWLVQGAAIYINIAAPCTTEIHTENQHLTLLVKPRVQPRFLHHLLILCFSCNPVIPKNKKSPKHFPFSVKIPIFASVPRAERSNAAKPAQLPNRYRLPNFLLFKSYLPTDYKKTIVFLQKLATEYNLAIYFSSHSIELLRKIKPSNIFHLQKELDNIAIVNPCYPSYATRDIYQHSGYDFLILVEDVLAKYILENIIDENALYKSKLINILPSGGWENVLKMQDDICKSNLAGVGTKVLSVLDGDVKPDFEQLYKQKGLYTNLTINFLPIHSLEKYLHEKIIVNKDADFFKEIGDRFFKVKSLKEVVDSLIKKNDDKAFYNYLIKNLKEQGIEENVFVQKVCEMIYRKEDMSKLLTFLQKTFQN
ncbi:hypothetical protein [Bacteroides uniformis]|uniref:hypothetical protein n=1 Tax=Bacteroides uniformis TaxID=820 RepID=UPI001EDCEA20|nr:hypothetical protein [Bacteroides uniformis]